MSLPIQLTAFPVLVGALLVSALVAQWYRARQPIAAGALSTNWGWIGQMASLPLAFLTTYYFAPRSLLDSMTTPDDVILLGETFLAIVGAFGVLHLIARLVGRYNLENEVRCSQYLTTTIPNVFFWSTIISTQGIQKMSLMVEMLITWALLIFFVQLVIQERSFINYARKKTVHSLVSSSVMAEASPLVKVAGSASATLLREEAFDDSYERESIMNSTLTSKSLSPHHSTNQKMRSGFSNDEDLTQVCDTYDHSQKVATYSPDIAKNAHRGQSDRQVSRSSTSHSEFEGILDDINDIQAMYKDYKIILNNNHDILKVQHDIQEKRRKLHNIYNIILAKVKNVYNSQKVDQISKKLIREINHMLLDICKDMNHTYDVVLKQVKNDYDIQSMVIDKIKILCDESIAKVQKKQKEIPNDNISGVRLDVLPNEQYNVLEEPKMWKYKMMGNVQMEEQCRAQEQLQERVEQMREQIQMEEQCRAQKQLQERIGQMREQIQMEEKRRARKQLQERIGQMREQIQMEEKRRAQKQLQERIEQMREQI